MSHAHNSHVCVEDLPSSVFKSQWHLHTFRGALRCTSQVTRSNVGFCVFHKVTLTYNPPIWGWPLRLGSRTTSVQVFSFVVKHLCLAVAVYLQTKVVLWTYHSSLLAVIVDQLFDSCVFCSINPQKMHILLKMCPKSIKIVMEKAQQLPISVWPIYRESRLSHMWVLSSFGCEFFRHS